MRDLKGISVGYWVTHGLFSLWMLFTAYAEVAIAPARAEFVQMGIPDYLRVELSIAKVIGVLVLLLPVSPRLKEWAYAGFAINLVSAVVAHLAIGEGPAKYMWAVVAALLLAACYFFWRKREVRTYEVGK